MRPFLKVTPRCAMRSPIGLLGTAWRSSKFAAQVFGKPSASVIGWQGSLRLRLPVVTQPQADDPRRCCQSRRGNAWVIGVSGRILIYDCALVRQVRDVAFGTPSAAGCAQANA